VNQWLWAATVLVALMAPLGGVALLAGRIDGLVAAQAAGVNLTLVLMMLSEGFRRTAYTTLALVAAVLTFAGSLVFVRYFDRELDP
jgi:multisubunit Na+/H+ antiporter MnhF subunit